MEGEGSPSNHEDQLAAPKAMEAAAESSSASSSSESGKISGLDGTASSHESGSSSSTSTSDEHSDFDSGGDVEIMLSDTDAKNMLLVLRRERLVNGVVRRLLRSWEKTWQA
jgi:hypothetical protein